MTNKLSPNQVKAVALLICGWKSVGVANELEISPQTLSKWKGEPAFRALLNQAKMDVLHEARQKLQVSADIAVDRLVEIATESDNEETSRKACMNIIQLVGLSDPSKGRFGWGIGATSAEAVIEEELRDQYIRDLSTPDFILDYRKRKSKEGS